MRFSTKAFLGAASLLTALAGSAAAQTAAAPPAPAPVPLPAMAGPIAADPAPLSFDLSGHGLDFLLSKIYVTGALTGLAYGQSAAHDIPGDRDVYADLTNGQVMIQKTDGWFQWYVQAGAYSFPALGVPYTSSGPNTGATFSAVPEAFVKLVLSDSFSIQAGKLPTLIGDEYNFTFQNMNVERGLMWGQEPAISRGVQVNYAVGSFSLSVALTDGYYSDRFDEISGLMSYAFNGGADTIAFAGSGNIGHTFYGNAGSTFWQNNDSVYNLIYTHVSGAWTISPYLQYVSVPTENYFGPIPGGSSTSGAVLVSYAFNDFWKLAGRVEYVSSSGATNFLYGSRSNAFSFTITPTWQYKVLYIRPEVSFVAAGSTTPGFALGPLGTDTNQFRGMLEAGILF